MSVTPLSDRFGWEVEIVGHRTVSQYNEDGTENPSSMIEPAKVVRASILPRILVMPRHDLLLDPEKENRFIRRFGRGILKDRGQGQELVEYIHCLVTTHYRVYVLSTSGQSLVTGPDYELYL